MKKIMLALQLSEYYAETNRIKKSDRLMKSIKEAWVEVRELNNIKPPQKEIKKPFEYANKLDWCPEINGFVAYILMCENGKMYKGYTGHFKQRMLQHFNGLGSITTRRMKPVYILHHEEYDNKQTVIARERFFKSPEGFNWIKSTTLLKTIKPTI